MSVLTARLALWFSKLLGLLLVLLVAGLLLLAALLLREDVNRWLLERLQQRVPELQFELRDGTVWRGWRFYSLSWQETDWGLRVDDLSLRWSPWCLLNSKLCIRRLSARQLDISLPDSDSAAGDLPLPDLQLPLALELRALALRQLSLNGEPLLQDLELQLSAARLDPRWRIGHFAGRGFGLQWQLAGRLRPQGDWPLEASGQLQLPTVDGRNWNLDLQQLGGNVRRLTVQAQSRGYLEGQLQGEIEPLAQGLPLRLQGEGRDFLARSDWPAWLTVRHWQLTAQGKLQQGLQFEGQLSLPENLAAAAVATRGQVRWGDTGWQVSGLELQQGDNRVQASGHWRREGIEARAQLALADLSQLWSPLRGDLAGTLTLESLAAIPAGQLPAETLQLRGQLRSDAMHWGDFELQDISVDGRLPLAALLPAAAGARSSGGAADLDLAVAQARIGDQLWGRWQLQLDGRPQAHSLQVSVTGAPVDIELQARGELSDDHWQLQWQRGSWEWQQQRWQLQQQPAMTVSLASRVVRMDGHCWQRGELSLCLQEEQRLWPDLALRGQLQGLTPQALVSEGIIDALPPGLRWEGDFEAGFELGRPRTGGWQLDLQLQGRDGAVHLTELSPEAADPEAEPETLTFAYQRLHLHTQLQPQQAQLTLQWQSEDQGQLRVEATVADPAAGQQLQGSYQLQGWRLELLRPWLPMVTRLAGELQGQGELGGRLREPRISGHLQLRQGHVSGPELPLVLDNLEADIHLDQQAIQIEGGWGSEQNGRASFSGRAGWAPWQLQLALQGESLALAVPPYATFSVNPDLTFVLSDDARSMTGKALQVRGSMAVPAGRIDLQELPPRAVQPSADATVVGLPQAERVRQPLSVDARIQLQLGEQVQLSAFGLEGRLQGNLMVQQDLSASGNLRVVDGRFERFGQELRLRRALLLFSGPVSRPYLDVEAVRRSGDVIAGLRLSGYPPRPQADVFSEPAMEQQQALSYLVLGRPLPSLEQTGGGNDRQLVTQAAVALGVAGSGSLTGRLASTLGLQALELGTEGSGADTRVVASGEISDRLSVRYGVGVFEPANQVALRYDLTRRLYMEAVSGFANSLDFFYSIDF